MPGNLAVPIVIGSARRCRSGNSTWTFRHCACKVAYGGQVVQALLQSKIGQIVGADLIAQKSGELFVLLDEGVFAVGAEDVMAVLDLLQGGVELALQFLGDAAAEDLRNLVGRQPPESNLAGAFEDSVNGEVALEDEIAAVLDLVDGVKAAEIHGAAFALGELRSQNQSPVFQAGANDIRSETVGGGLQGGDVINGQKGVVVFAETDFFPV